VSARALLEQLRKHVAEVLETIAILAGWGFLTAGIAALTSPIAWLFSLGLLGLCLAGIKYVGVLAWEGLYALTREVKRGT
jgi:hypothetical protein